MILIQAPPPPPPSNNASPLELGIVGWFIVMLILVYLRNQLIKAQ